MGEIETQTVRLDQRTCLLDVVAKDFLHGSLEKVGCRVVKNDPLPPLSINLDGC